MNIKEKLTDLVKKHKGKLTAAIMIGALAAPLVVTNQQKIGTYRPAALSAMHTSYVAYDKGDAIHLYLPAIDGMVRGPIIDKDKDGIIDYVGTIRYPRMPFSFNDLELGDVEDREHRRQMWQKEYDSVMARIR